MEQPVTLLPDPLKNMALDLGVDVLFPAPFTILIVKNKRMNRWCKIGLIVIAWVVYLGISLQIGKTMNSTDTVTPQNSIEDDKMQENSQSELLENTSGGQSELTLESGTKESTIDTIVDEYNTAAPNKMVFVESFDVQDKESGHYRTEFRLTAFLNATGRAYKVGDSNIDIIAMQNVFDEIDVRIYSVGTTFDQCVDLIKYLSPLLDPSMDETTVDETISFFTENREANGYYYGELGLVVTGDDDKGYSMMIKTD